MSSVLFSVENLEGTGRFRSWNPSCFPECAVQHRLCSGRTLRPIEQPSGESVPRARPSRRLNVQANNANGGTSKEPMSLNVGVGSYDHALDSDIKFELRSVGFDERDRALGVASALGLQNGHDSWRTGSALQGRSCDSVSRATSRDKCHCSEERKQPYWDVVTVHHLIFLSSQ